MVLLKILTFLAAFLMFQIELIIAKSFLPHYGGSYLVWGACLVFFQAILLAAYVFAHAGIQRWGMPVYLRLHSCLLFFPFLFFPVRNFHLSFASLSLPLVLDIFARLLLTIGPVFFALATMSLVTQSWLASSQIKGRQDPYQLYAVSNLGSFAGLLTYPFVFEKYLAVSQQWQIWRALYLLLVLAHVAAWLLIKTKAAPRAEGAGENDQQGPQPILRWLCLGAAGVMMFMSVTNIMTYEVAPVPLLWVFPLGIYLMAFVLNFKKKPWCPSWISRFIGGVIGWAALMYFLPLKHYLPVPLDILIYCGLLFWICMFTQQSLINSKPNQANAMTLFYVMISLGGFIGGMLTSWIIPLISNTLMEYLAGLWLTALMLPSSGRRASWWSMAFWTAVVLSAFLIWPQLVKGYHLWSFVLLWAGVGFAFGGLSRSKRILVPVLFGLILLTPYLESVWQNAHFIVKKRNYYGIYEVYDKSNGLRALVHGTTLHGVEFVDQAKHRIPLGYYSPVSAIGSLLIDDTFQARHLAVVGLGAGTLSMYAKLNCPVDFYELDQDVKHLASTYFWYMAEAPGNVNVILGDARLSLKNAADGAYDLLAIDAFSGDAIPTHLVNKDVLEEYRRKLAPRGGIAFHITNRYLNLEPVLAKMAMDSGAYAAIKDVKDGGVNMRAIWVVLTWDEERFFNMLSKEGWQPLAVDPKYLSRAWSDDYSSILPIINMNELAVSMKSFKFWTW